MKLRLIAALALLALASPALAGKKSKSDQKQPAAAATKESDAKGDKAEKKDPPADASSKKKGKKG